MKRWMRWLCLAFLPPIATLVLVAVHKPGDGIVLCVATIAFCALLFISALPGIWRSWRNINALPLSPNQFSDFVMQPGFLIYNNIKNMDPQKWRNVLYAVLCAIPSFACIPLLHHVGISSGWIAFQREMTTPNIDAIYDQNSIYIRTSPKDMQTFIHEIHSITANALTVNDWTNSGLRGFSAYGSFKIVCKDGYQVLLLNVDNKGTLGIANASQSVAQVTEYDFNDPILYAWYKRLENQPVNG